MDTYVVQAEYSFKGENNDELCFKKGDVITVTQREDGGWWEGTLGEMTGWFPSNYVKEYSGELYLYRHRASISYFVIFRSRAKYGNI